MMPIQRIQRISPLGAAQQGVVLIEAMIAILIFSVGVLGIVGMQAAMVKNTSDSKYRADAAYIAQQNIGLIWTNPAIQADPSTIPSDISGLLPSGTLSVTRAGDQFTITVRWQQPGEAEQHNFTTIATIVGV
jgi:type IV pilus assembly protein PilV